MFTQRSSVVLPDPLGPITTTVSPRPTVSDTPRRTSLAPKRLTMPDMSSMGRSMANEDSALKVFPIQGQSVADAEIHGCRSDEDLERGQRALHHLPAGHGQFPQPDDRNERCRLDEIDAQVDEWGRGEAH